ncbi:hypothetical protein HZS61_011239 [Fusarium oxysporum f. sp. conglutinans]|uniref:Probable dipeptidyl-aminopeptidase B n=2 Tax=Fusarium oxysporum f. sp. conglutinans TaxID=100902 RepID=A0A8H6GWK6_FUSOX|nr:hypothetical protein HZS61_011239 [Fusarium oxysporum f. sp. conglutinans]
MDRRLYLTLFLAFLIFNETGVGIFTIPYYMDNEKLAPTYPRELDLRYLKVGSKNPTVELNILDLSDREYKPVPVDAFEPEELIIGEVAWVTKDHSALIYRAFNRVQDHDAHVVVNPETLKSKVVRKRDGSDGWLEHTLSISFVGPLSCKKDTYYVDVSDEDGWNHIYLYHVKGGKAIQLTSGEWEVSTILNIDTAKKLVYFQASKRHSTERHVYNVSWETKKIPPLVDDTVPGYWLASFSSSGGYYILNYQGPNVPYQELYTTNTTSKPVRTLVDNKAFYKNITQYSMCWKIRGSPFPSGFRLTPNITYFKVQHPDGYTLNDMQQLPVNFDPAKKYPVLFTLYGGPNS